MQVTTFYSYKGGVGRTLACANFGVYLAKTGRRIVLADMDFEAPGLDSKFPELANTEITSGLLDQFAAFQGGGELPEIRAIEIPLPDENVQSGGRLSLIPAGNYLSGDYYKTLSELNWDFFLKEKAGLAFCLELLKRIEKSLNPDILVIDSRTGLTEIGGLCTQVFPDCVILLTCTSRESLRGTKRIYERIANSPIVKSRSGGRDQIDIRVVVSRVPKPENLPDFDRAMSSRLDLPVERLYYLFDQKDLAMEEYLAFDKLPEHPPILEQYVELFASFNPEATQPYVAKRLEEFRLQLTRRSMEQNDAIIQELLTLFPVLEVMLEAARFYRLVRNGDAKAVENYIRYLDACPDDKDALFEFVEFSATVPLGELKPRQNVAEYFRRFGAERMTPKMLARFEEFAEKEDLLKIVQIIENDPVKLSNRNFRHRYLMVLYALGDMKRISMTVTEEDLSSTPLRIKVAQAFAIVGKPEEAIGIIRIAKTVDYYECFGILTVFFLANLGLDEVKQQRLFPFHMIKVLTLNPVMWSDEYFAIFDDRKKKAFREWMEQLAMAAKAE